MFKHLASIFVAMTLLFTGYAAMSKEHDHDHEEHNLTHEAHTHGIATLLIVLEGDTLEIELRSPAINLLGFEGTARTQEQQTQVANAKTVLSKGDELFDIDSANCQLVSHDTDFGDELEQHHDHHETDTSDSRENHNDLEAHYRFRCKREGEVEVLSTNILREFSAIESVEVQWIVDDRQGAAMLNSHQHQVIFR